MKKSTNPFSGLLKGRLSLFQNQFLDSSHPSQERYPDPALVIPDKRFEKYCQFNAAVEKVLETISSSVQKWKELINISFLSKEMKGKYLLRRCNPEPVDQ